MTITLTLRDIVLIIAAVFLCFGIAYFIAVLKRLRAVAEEVEKTVRQVRELIPKVDRLAHESAETLRTVRELADSGRGVVEDVTAVSAKLRAFAEEGLGYAAILIEPLRRIAAIVTGIQTGLTVFKSFTGRFKDAAYGSKEDEDEEGNN
jgi:hypothetical protein